MQELAYYCRYSMADVTPPLTSCNAALPNPLWVQPLRFASEDTMPQTRCCSAVTPTAQRGVRLSPPFRRLRA